MRFLLFMFMILASSYIYADDISESDFVEDQDSNLETSGLEKDEMIKCSRDKRKLKHELKKIKNSDSEMYSYLQESYNEELKICGDDQKCICNVYPYLINEMKNKKNEFSSKNDYKSNEDTYVEPPRKVRPKYSPRQDFNSENSYEISEGKRLKVEGQHDIKVAERLSTAATWMFVLGGVSSLTGIILIATEPDMVGVGIAMTVIGGIPLIVAIPLVIVSSSIRRRGKAKMAQANGSNSVAFNIYPIISPKEKKYGLALSFNY